MYKHLLHNLTTAQQLSVAEADWLIDQIAIDRLSDAQLAAVLIALLQKGLNVAEVCALVQAMQRHLVTVPVRTDLPLLDTCGTGGGLSTFNISTATALVCAAAGIAVANHGSRSVSSLSGSIDVLEALGVAIDLTPTAHARMLQQCGITFLHAPNFNPVMRRILPVEASLGIKTIFYTLLGPLLNPARVNRHLLGVYKPELAELACGVLQQLGMSQAMVVHGLAGLDELSLLGPSRVLHCQTAQKQDQPAQIQDFLLTPEMLGLARCQLSDLRSQPPQHNAELIRRIFAGTEQGPCRDAVLLNAAAALQLGDKVSSLQEGLQLASQLLDSQAVLRQLQQTVVAASDFASQLPIRPVLAPPPAEPTAPSEAADSSASSNEAWRALKASEQNKRARLKTLIETLPDLIWLTDCAGRLLNCNRKFERLAGLPEAAIKGKTAAELFAPAHSQLWQQQQQLALQERRTVFSQHWLNYPCQTQLHQEFVELIHTPLIDEQDQLLGVLGIARDITAQKAYEEELRRHRDELELLVQQRTEALSLALEQLQQTQHQLIEAEKSAALGAVVAGISHELNTPVGNILTVLSSLQPELAQLKEQLQNGSLSKSGLEQFLQTSSQLLQLAETAAQRTVGLLADFKQISAERIAEQRRSFDLAELVSANLVALQLLFQSNRIKLENQIPTGIVCHSYPGAIGQILSHLLQNTLLHAFDGLPQTGRPAPAVQLTAVVEGSQLQLQISDNGIGMNHATLYRLFEPFFTTDMAKGSGIGLPLCKRLAVGVLGGDLTASAQIGRGSQFILQIPLSAPGYH